MRKLILKMSVSVDGFVAGPNGELDWIFESMDDSTAAWTLETLWQAGVHIMGSRTYYDMASYWPSSTEPFAAPMNEIPKVVFSRRGFVERPRPELTTVGLQSASRARPVHRSAPSALMEAAWAGAKVASGDMAEEIARLKAQPGKDILAHGGARFAQSLVQTGLIDEYRLLVHPAALGAGLPLFSALPSSLRLRLVRATAFGSGAVAQVYQPA